LRALYEYSSDEYFAVWDFWQTIGRDKRRELVPRVEPLDWMFLTGIEKAHAIQGLIDGGYVRV